MVGASRGGVLVRLFQAEYPTDFAGMVLIDPTAEDRLFGDLPVILLSRGLNASPEQRAAHVEISRISRNARHLVVADSYHEIHLSHPGVVVAAIRDVVASVRTKAPLR